MEKLTDPEILALDADPITCPDCGGREFREGPQAGISINLTCKNCSSAFSVAPGFDGEFGKERIARPNIKIGRGSTLIHCVGYSYGDASKSRATTIGLVDGTVITIRDGYMKIGVI